MVGPVPGFASHGFDPIVRIPKENDDQRILEIVIGIPTLATRVATATVTATTTATTTGIDHRLPLFWHGYATATATATSCAGFDHARQVVRIGLKPVLLVEQGIGNGEVRKALLQIVGEKGGPAVALAEDNDFAGGTSLSQDVDSEPGEPRR